MNEIAAVLEVQSLCGPALDCHAWLALSLEDGAELDFCSLCSRPAAHHPDDAFPDDDADEDDDNDDV